MRTKGWQKVLSFTLVQHMKTKSFIVGTIVICVIVALLVAGLNIIPKLVSGEEDISADAAGSPASFSAVYLMDDSGLLTAKDETRASPSL